MTTKTFYPAFFNINEISKTTTSRIYEYLTVNQIYERQKWFENGNATKVEHESFLEYTVMHRIWIIINIESFEWEEV